jgi:hypothetical protein
MPEDRAEHAKRHQLFAKELRAAGGTGTDSRYSRLGVTDDGDLLAAELARIRARFGKTSA